MTTLPIQELRPALAAAARAQRRLIVRAPTGSGKSTQIPQYLLDDGLLPRGKVVVLQPRRLAVRLLAARVAQERGVRLGEEVGYRIRFEDRSGPSTLIQYETEGILLRQMQSNADLDGIDAVVFDEFHERHLYGDVTLARTLQLQQTRRPDLLIVVMSATLDTEPLVRYLDKPAVLTSDGRTHPVAIQYLARPLPARGATAMEAAARELERLVQGGAPGDALIFMPGAYEIQQTIRAIESSAILKSCIVLPLHGELPPRDQDAAVAHHDRRKIVVATNVAETSVTIDGIRIVIDSGLVRRPHFDPHRGINTLWIEKISRASADQRAGRAGRTAPGLCVRLWTEQEHGGRALHDLPEIKRLDLSEILLTLKAAGIDEASGFAWLEPPDPAARERAMTLLRDLGAVAGPQDRVTALGRRMAAFPLHPRYARMLLAAEQYRTVRPVALIAALTQGRSLFTHRQDRSALERREELLGESAASDFLVWMRAWHYAARQRFSVEACRQLGIHAQAARQVQPVFDSFLRIAAQQGLTVEDRQAADEDLSRCVLAGFADQVAVRRDEGTRVCRVVHGRTGRLAPDSAVRDARLVVASEINEIQRGRDGEGEVMLQLATRIEEDWLTELFPDAVRTVDAAWYDPASKRVLREERRMYHDLVLQSKRGGTPPQEEAARLLADQVLQGHLTLNHWDQAVKQWIARVNNLSAWCPDLGLPSIDQEEKRLLFEQLCLGAYSYKDIRNKPVRPILHSLLSPAQRALVERHAPECLQLGGARAFRLLYTPDAPPALSARIQELFGVTRLPRIAQGKVQPVVHILAPNQRPVQITQDLPGFWREHYPGIRQTLKRKYPKHAWPEDAGQSE